MKKIITLFILLTTYFGHTQTLSVEAESGKLYRGASIQNCSSCSNLQQVGDLGGATAESAYFTSTVNVAAAGTYKMNLSFSSGETRTLFISPNGSAPVEVALNSGDWGVVGTQEIQIELNAGTNTIKFYNYNGYTPNIDKYTLTLAIASNPCTSCIGPFEAENATVFAPATIQGCDTCSNGQQVGDLGYSNRYFTQDVMITIPGTYRVYISYSSGSPRSLSVTANETTTVSGVFHSIDWDAVFVKYLDITLAAGNNTLKFHTPEDWSPNIDKFRLELLDGNANLNDLKIDGITVNGFSSATTDYTYNVAFGTTTVPQITLTNSANSTATKVITQASGLPGTATVVITSSDATTTKTYTINYGINPILSVEAESGKLYRGASIQNCSSCSNLQQVGDMGGFSAESAYFTSTVNMASAGTYSMNLSFSSGETRTIFISPNGLTPIEVALNSGDWGVVGSQEIQVPLNAGTNTIKFYNYNGYTPNIDKFTLSLATASNPCTTCFGPFEAENATVFAPATVQNCDTCSNGQQVGDMGYLDRYFTQDVMITIPGTYRIYISYSSGSPRSLSVTANETTTVSGVFHSIDWDAVFVKYLDITLAAGNNTLKFHNPGDWAPNIDKFRLELLNTTWTGSTDTSWADPGNWLAGVPDQNSNVIIPSAPTNQPTIGTTLNVNINSLTIDSGATLTAFGKLTVTGAITNNGDLILKSSATGTAALLSGSSVANVTQERYLSSNQRGWRLLSNPLSTITFGTLAAGAGTPNTTITLGANASGAYMSDTNTWTSTDDAASMLSQQAYKVFLRGRTSEVTGLNYFPSGIIPSNVTLSVKGTATNTAPATVTTTENKYYLVANPYTAPVSLSSIIAASSGLSNSVSYYNPTKAATDVKVKAGGYDVVTISGAAGSATDIVLPPMGAIFVQASSAGTINVPKTAIFTGTPGQTGTYNHKMAQTKATTTALKVKVMSGSTYYDAINLQFKPVGDIGTNIDFGKLPNEILDFYSINGSTNMAVSELELKDQIIPLGITTSTIPKSYTLNVAENTIPAGFEAELIDNVLNTTTALTPGTDYNFTIDSTPASQGNARFAINLKTAGTLSVTTNELNSKIELWPNPAQNQFNISNSNAGVTSIEISNLNGQVIHSQKLNSGITTILTSGWAKGVYLLKTTNNSNHTTKKFIIQ